MSREAAWEVGSPPAGGAACIPMAKARGLTPRFDKRLAMNDVVRFQPGTGTVALDGEREIELSTTSVVEVRLCADGPYVVDVPATLEGAALAGHLRRQQVE